MQPVPRSFQAHRPVLDEAWPAQPPGSPRYDPKQNFRLPLELEILTNRRCAPFVGAGSTGSKDAKGVRGETARPRRVSAALLDDCDKGTWNLSIYCNSSGRPSITHVTSRDPTLDAVGTRSCAIRGGMSKKRATTIFDLSLRVDPRIPKRK